MISNKSGNFSTRFHVRPRAIGEPTASTRVNGGNQAVDEAHLSVLFNPPTILSVPLIHTRRFLPRTTENALTLMKPHLQFLAPQLVAPLQFRDNPMAFKFYLAFFSDVICFSCQVNTVRSFPL